MAAMKMGNVDTCRCDIVFDILSTRPGRPATESGICMTPKQRNIKKEVLLWWHIEGNYELGRTLVLLKGVVR